MAAYDLILRGGTCVLPWGEEKADVGVRDGRIAALGDLRTDTAEEVVDCAGLHVLPGLIDPHVHLRDPGQGAGPDMTVESIETGTRAAILGGITALFDMPNTNPAITTREALELAFARLGVLWRDRATWERMQHNAMTADVGWSRPARQYAALYHEIMR